MKRISRAVTALIMGASAFVFAPVASASADTGIVCQGQIVDQTADHVLITSKVDESIKAVEQYGADVYVRAFQATPGGSTDAFWQQGLQQCPNWRAPVGNNPKPNIIMVVFGMDHTSAIFYGGNFASLKSSVDSIRANKMNASFRNGDFTGGTTQALDAISSDINPNRSAEPAFNYMPIIWWVSGVIGLIALCVLLWFAIPKLMYWRRRVREDRQRRLNAQKEAKAAKKRVEDLIVSSRDSGSMARDFLIASGGVPDELLIEPRRSLQSLKLDITELSSSYATLNMDSANDPERVFNTDREYRDITRLYSQIADGIERDNKKFDSVLSSLEELRTALTLESRTQSAKDIETRLFQAERSLAKWCKVFFDVSEFETKLQDLRQRLTSVNILLDDKSKTLESYIELCRLQDECYAFRVDIGQLLSDATKIGEARQTLNGKVLSRRKILLSLEHVDTQDALSELDQIEIELDRFVSGLVPKRSRQGKLSAIDVFGQKINAIGKDEVKRNEVIVEEERRAAKKKRDKEAAARNHYGRSPSSDSFLGGAVGGYIGSSYGSSHSSSSSSSSSDFGSSSGSWGGGGFDGGGSSGSW